MAKHTLRSALAGRDAHIRTLRIALVLMTGVTLTALYGWFQAGQDIVVHNPPDLTSGVSRPWWEVPKPNVYAFATQIFTQINRWSKDGATDYEKNLNLFQDYLTPQCRATLERDFEQKRARGELSGRERSLSQIPSLGYDDDSVRVLDKDHWIANVDLELKEYVGQEVVKHDYIRWPIRVVRYDIDRNHNPWQLALDCFEGTPKLIRFKPTKKEGASS